MNAEFNQRNDKFGLMPKAATEYFGGGGGGGGGGGCVHTGIIAGFLGAGTAIATGSNVRDGALAGALSGASAWAGCAGSRK